MSKGASPLPAKLLALPTDLFSAPAKKVAKVAAPAASKSAAASAPKPASKVAPRKAAPKRAPKASKETVPAPAAADEKASKQTRKVATRKSKSVKRAKVVAVVKKSVKTNLDDFFNSNLAQKIASILRTSGAKKDSEIGARISEIAKKLQQEKVAVA